MIPSVSNVNNVKNIDFTQFNIKNNANYQYNSTHSKLQRDNFINSNNIKKAVNFTGGNPLEIGQKLLDIDGSKLSSKLSKKMTTFTESILETTILGLRKITGRNKLSIVEKPFITADSAGARDDTLLNEALKMLKDSNLRQNSAMRTTLQNLVDNKQYVGSTDYLGTNYVGKLTTAVNDARTSVGYDPITSFGKDLGDINFDDVGDIGETVQEHTSSFLEGVSELKEHLVETVKDHASDLGEHLSVLKEHIVEIMKDAFS